MIIEDEERPNLRELEKLFVYKNIKVHRINREEMSSENCWRTYWRIAIINKSKQIPRVRRWRVESFVEKLT